jgi:hypothetical protein
MSSNFQFTISVFNGPNRLLKNQFIATKTRRHEGAQSHDESLHCLGAASCLCVLVANSHFSAASYSLRRLFDSGQRLLLQVDGVHKETSCAKQQQRDQRDY